MPRSLVASLVLGLMLMAAAPVAFAEDERVPVAELLQLVDDARQPAASRRMVSDAPPPADLAPAPIAEEAVPAPIAEDAYAGPTMRRRRAVCCPKRFVRAEGGFALMQDPEGPLGLDSGAANQIQWDENELDTSFAARLAVGSRMGRGSVEAEATWYDTFEGDSAQTGVFGFAPPAGSVSAATPAALSSEVDLWTGHATWWCPKRQGRCDTWSLGLGVRTVYFREIAKAEGLTIPGAGAGRIESDAENRFIGAEIGVRYERRMGSRWTVQAYGLGLFGSINRDLSVRDTSIFSPGAHRATSEADEFAWGVNAGVRLGWRLSSRLTLTASYDLLFLDGVVRGHDAIDTSRAGTGAVQARQSEGDFIAHAVFVGLELRF